MHPLLHGLTPAGANLPTMLAAVQSFAHKPLI
jgi:hypothetical protein